MVRPRPLKSCLGLPAAVNCCWVWRGCECFDHGLGPEFGLWGGMYPACKLEARDWCSPNSPMTCGPGGWSPAEAERDAYMEFAFPWACWGSLLIFCNNIGLQWRFLLLQCWKPFSPLNLDKIMWASGSAGVEAAFFGMWNGSMRGAQLVSLAKKMRQQMLHKMWKMPVCISSWSQGAPLEQFSANRSICWITPSGLALPLGSGTDPSPCYFNSP